MHKTPHIAIYTQVNLIAEALIAKLISEGCEVFVCTNHNAWKEKIPAAHLVNENYPTLNECDYVISIGELKFIPHLKKALTNPHTKGLVLLPYVGKDALLTLHKAVTELGDNPRIKVLLAGDGYSENMNINTDSPVAKILLAVASQQPIPFREDFELYPVYLPDAVEHIIRVLFSYWYHAGPQAIATKTRVKDFLAELGQQSSIFLPGTQLATTVAYTAHLTTPKHKTPNAAKKVLDSLAVKAPPVQAQAVAVAPVVVPPTAVKTRRRLPLRRKFAVFLVFLCLLLPFVPIALASALMGIGYTQIKSGNSIRAESLFEISTTNALVSKRIFGSLASLPVAGRLFEPLALASNKVEDISRMGARGAKIINMGKTLVSGILTNQDYELEELSRSLSLELAALYEESSFFQQSLGEGSVLEWTKLRRYLLIASKLSKQLPELIGDNKQHTYLVLLQNNMELRPTGGFIGSFALVSFDKGKLIDTSVYDVYTADGQLKGHVEPPAAIRDYLGEANWYLRDSNWDPDFPSSASRAEWFLDKELDRKVDGVVGVDLEVAKGLLEVIGPLSIADFGSVIDHKNLYEKVQHEVEDDFFPGSQKKATLLTALTRELLRILPEVQESKLPQLAKVLATGLEGRHIQVALHNASAAEIFDEAGWNGEVEIAECGRKCTPAWLGIAEANVGVNKANYYLKRKMEVDIVPGQENIAYTVKVTLTNQSSQDLALGGRYKAYLRALALPGSTFAPIEIRSGLETILRDPEIAGTRDRSEAGVVVDVPPKSMREVIFRFSTPASVDLKTPGELAIGIRKQAGTVADPLTVRVFAPNGVMLYGNPAPSLTQAGNLGYNSSLEADFSARVNW